MVGDLLDEATTPLGGIPDGWQVVRLKEITSKIGSGATPTGGERVYLSSRQRVALVRSQNVYDRRFSDDGLVFIAEAHAELLAGAAIQPNDLLLNITGDGITFGRVCLAPADVLPACVNQHVSIIRPAPNRCVSGYLLAYLTHSTIKHYIESFNAGGSRRAVTKGHIESFLVPLPPLEEQREIARILGTLDDKIELNRRMNATMEELARAVFRSWFVDFDPVVAKAAGRRPVGMNAATAALFPKSFEDSHVGSIPKGWQVDQLKNRASRIQYGLTTSATAHTIGTRFLRITDIQGGSVNWRTVPSCELSPGDHEKYRIEDGDIFIARTGASTGENVYIVDPPDAVFASYLVRVNFPLRETAKLVGEFFRTKEYADYVAGVLGGSAQPNANAQELTGAEFVFPPEPIARTYFERFDPIDRAKAARLQQNATLAALRDALLPRLLSGELRLKDAERAVESAV